MKRLSFCPLLLCLLLTSFNSWGQGDVASALEKTKAAPGASSKVDSVVKFLDGPQGILLLSAVSTVYSGILYKAADKQEKDSRDNIKKIDQILTAFNDSYAGFCPLGREDINNPSCYCYTEDKKKNPNRTNSQICQALWKKGEYKLGADAENYNALPFDPNVAGCITLSGQFDENCQCRKFIDDKGKNACKKSEVITLPSDAFGSGFAMSTGLKDLAQLAANTGNGNPRFDLMNAGDLTTKAINARKLSGELLKKLQETNPNLIGNAANEGNVGKLARAVLGEDNIKNNLAQGGAPAMDVSALRSGTPAMNELLKEAQAKVNIDIAGTGNGLNRKKKNKPESLDLDLGSGAVASASRESLQDFPEKNYKYKNSDISVEEGASLFEIISNRYVQSGLRRLFEDAKH